MYSDQVLGPLLIPGMSNGSGARVRLEFRRCLCNGCQKGILGGSTDPQDRFYTEEKKKK